MFAYFLYWLVNIGDNELKSPIDENKLKRQKKLTRQFNHDIDTTPEIPLKEVAAPIWVNEHDLVIDEAYNRAIELLHSTHRLTTPPAGTTWWQWFSDDMGLVTIELNAANDWRPKWMRGPLGPELEAPEPGHFETAMRDLAERTHQGQKPRKLVLRWKGYQSNCRAARDPKDFKEKYATLAETQPMTLHDMEFEHDPRACSSVKEWRNLIRCQLLIGDDLGEMQTRTTLWQLFVIDGNRSETSSLLYNAGGGARCLSDEQFFTRIRDDKNPVILYTFDFLSDDDFEDDVHDWESTINYSDLMKRLGTSSSVDLAQALEEDVPVKAVDPQGALRAENP